MRSNQHVDIRIVNKAHLLVHEIELLRDQITIYHTSLHQGVIRLIDYFENKDFMYFCQERSNSIDEKQILMLSNGSDQLDINTPMYRALQDVTNSQYLNLHNYIIYYKHKPKSEFIQIDERYKEIAMNLLETIDHLHTLGIVLRDLNVYNIMMDAVTDAAFPRVSSLKAAIIQGPENQTTGIPTKNYEFIAPEVISLLPYNNKVDSWSFGVVLYYMLAGKLPFSSDIQGIALED